MTTHQVKVQETHEVTWIVSANSIQEAKEGAIDGLGEWEQSEFSHIIEDTNTIKVKEL